MKEEIPFLEEEEEIYDGFFRFELQHLRKKEKAMTYAVLDLKADGVTILGEMQGKYLLLREYRYPLKDHIYGLPGGRMEEGEEIFSAARREFLEETGYEASSLKYLGPYYPLPSVCKHKIHLFYTSQITQKGEPQRDAFESMEIHFFTEEEILEKIRNQEKLDGTIINLLFYKKFLSK